MRRYPLYITVVWIALGIFVLSYAYTAGLGRLSSPGPGFMPFWVGVIIACLALYKLLKEFVFKEKKAGQENAAGSATGTSFVGKLLFLTLTIVVYALLLEPLGYLVDTFLVLVVLLRFAGYTQWIRILIYSLIIVVISYFVFKYLGVKFPAGVLGYFGLY